MSIYTNILEKKASARLMLEALIIEHIAKNGAEAIKVLAPRKRR